MVNGFYILFTGNIRLSAGKEVILNNLLNDNKSMIIIKSWGLCSLCHS